MKKISMGILLLFSQNSLRLFGLILVMTANLYPQIPEQIQRYRNDLRGNILDRKKGLIEGNRVRTTFSNNGEVSDWIDGAVSAPHLEWPKGTGHRHADGYSFFVGAKVKIINDIGQELLITPIETSYREEMDKDPVTGSFWGFEPIAGYRNPGISSVAISTNPDTWPTTWPAALKLPTNYNGDWYSHYGKGIRDSVVETFYVMDDSQDKEFTRPPYSFYPVHSDSTWGGLGLRVEVRGLQFKDSLLQDITFWNYSITNVSDNDYDSTIFGYFLDPAVGSVLNDAKIDMSTNLVYVWAPSGKGLPDNYKTGYLGLATLTSAVNQLGVSSIYLSILSNKGPGSMWPKNDGVIWSNLSREIKDTVITGANVMIWCSTGPFSFPKYSTKKFTIAMVFGEDLQEITKKSSLANKVYRSDYVISDSILSVDDPENNLVIPQDFYLFQNFPNPFNPTTNIQFSTPDNNVVTLKIYNILGKEIATLANGYLSAGSFRVQWNAAGFSSGVYFYTLHAGNFVSTKKLILLK